MVNTRGKATGFLLIMQAIFAVLFGLFVDYDHFGISRNHKHNRSDHMTAANRMTHYYPAFKDVQVMMLIGFGFLMSFLRKHSFGSIGFNFLLPCYVIEWATLVNGWFSMIGSNNTVISVNVLTILDADFAAISVLISFAAVLGKVSPIQLLLMATFEVVFYNIDLFIDLSILKVLDVASSIHTFGAYFGLAVSRVLYKTHHTTSHKDKSVYHSDLFAVFGTLFLWLYWPTFNSAVELHHERNRAIINTVLSVVSCTVVTFALSTASSKKNELTMEHIQNATIAGGVVIAPCANLMVYPFGAIVIGGLAAIISLIGFEYIQPLLEKKWKLHDTCGVHNLHGMPGILGTMISSIVCDVATREIYKDSFYEIFPDGRTGLAEGGYQMAGLVATVGIALIGGTITGFVLKIPIWDKLLGDELYDDGAFWLTPDDDDDVAEATQPYTDHENKNFTRKIECKIVTAATEEPKCENTC